MLLYFQVHCNSIIRYINEFAAVSRRQRYTCIIKRENEGKFNLQTNSLGGTRPSLFAPMC